MREGTELSEDQAIAGYITFVMLDESIDRVVELGRGRFQDEDALEYVWGELPDPDGYTVFQADKEDAGGDIVADKPVSAETISQKLDKPIGFLIEQGRPLRRKERNEIKEQVELELIPKAFTRSHHTSAYIDLDQQIVVVDAASSSEAETLLSELRETLGSLPVRPPAVNQSPGFTMTQWVAGQVHMPQYLSHDSECELRDTDETPVVVKVKGLDLGAEEITSHINNGMMVQKLALNWGESLSFVLDDELTLRRIHFTDQMKEALDDQADDDAIERFNSAFSLMTLEISRLLPTLLEGFGGEDTSAMAA